MKEVKTKRFLAEATIKFSKSGNITVKSKNEAGEVFKGKFSSFSEAMDKLRGAFNVWGIEFVLDGEYDKVVK